MKQAYHTNLRSRIFKFIQLLILYINEKPGHLKDARKATPGFSRTNLDDLLGPWHGYTDKQNESRRNAQSAATIILLIPNRVALDIYIRTLIWKNVNSINGDFKFLQITNANLDFPA